MKFYEGTDNKIHDTQFTGAKECQKLEKTEHTEEHHSQPPK